MRTTISSLCLLCIVIVTAALTAAHPLTGPTVTNLGPVGAITGFTKRVFLTANSPEGCAITYSIVSNPANGTLSQLDTATGLVLYKSSAGFTGTDTFTFQATANTTAGCTATPVTSSTGTVSVNVQNTRTTVSGHLTQPDGTTPQVGQVVWTLAQTATTFDGIFIVSGSSVARTLDSGGNYIVSLYSTVALSPNVFYVATLVQGSSRTTLGYFQIPASTSTVNQAALNANQIYKLGDAQVQLATADQVEALANEVDAIVLNHSLLGSIHNDTVPASSTRGAIIVGNSTPKWAAVPRGGAGTYVRSDGTDTGFSSILDGDLPATMASKTLNTTVLNGPTINNGSISGIVNNTGSIIGGTYTSPTISGGTLSGTFSGAPVINCSACTGIGSPGGVINVGSTTIGADSGGSGSGIIDFQTHNGISRFTVQNNGDLTFKNPFILTAQSAPTLSGSGFAKFYYDSSLHQVMLSTEGGAFAAITASTAATALRYDVQRDFGASGSDQQTTGSITGSTATLTLANAKDFINGDGIMIAGAGTSGHNCINTVSSGGGTTTITLASTCATTVSGAAVKHDDSAAINTALSTVGAAGGGSILFKMKDRNGLAGKYHAAGPLQSNCNSVLCLAQVTRLQNPVWINLVGEVPLNITGSSITPTNGSILDATDFNDSTPTNYGAMIGGKTYSGTISVSDTTFNYTWVTLDNFIFRVKPNPDLAVLQFHNTEGLTVNNSFIDDGEAVTFSGSTFSLLTQPTNTNNVGIITPGINNVGGSTIHNVGIVGQKVGVLPGDNVRFLGNDYIIQCDTGLKFHDNAAMVSGDLGIYTVTNPVVAVSDEGLGESIVNLKGLEIQISTGTGRWYDTASGHQIYDPSNYLQGSIEGIFNGTTPPTNTGMAGVSFLDNFFGRYTLSSTTGDSFMTIQQNSTGSPSVSGQLSLKNSTGDILGLYVPGSAYGVTALRRNAVWSSTNDSYFSTGSSNTFHFQFNLANEILTMEPFFGIGRSTFRGIAKIPTSQYPPNSPSQITADQNNYTPGSGSFQRWNSNASHNITGMTAGQDGESMEIWNVGSQNIVIQNENTSSTAANRFTTTTGADITLAPNQVAFVRYDVTSARWRVTKGN